MTWTLREGCILLASDQNEYMQIRRKLDGSQSMKFLGCFKFWGINFRHKTENDYENVKPFIDLFQNNSDFQKQFVPNQELSQI